MNQWKYDHLTPEDFEQPEPPEPKLSAEEEASRELLQQLSIPGMREVTWERLINNVKAHPDFSDALADLARGECSTMREITRATAVTMVRDHMRQQRGK